MSAPRHWTPRPIRALLALLFCAGLLGCQPAALPLHGTDIAGSGLGQHWTLTDGDGQPRAMSDYRGELVLIYFGFTHCPDVCPATLGHLRGALELLGPLAAQVRVLFITVDADNDTPAAMKAYVTGFGSRFVGLSGSASALASAAKDFRAYFAKKPDSTGMGFEHSGFVYLFDRTGAPREIYPPDATPQDIAADLRILLQAK